MCLVCQKDSFGVIMGRPFVMRRDPLSGAKEVAAKRQVRREEIRTPSLEGAKRPTSGEGGKNAQGCDHFTCARRRVKGLRNDGERSHRP